MWGRGRRMKEDNGGSGNVMLRRMELRRSTSMRVGWGNGARRRMRNCMRPRRRMLGKGYAKTYGDGGGRWRVRVRDGVTLRKSPALSRSTPEVGLSLSIGMAADTAWG